MVFRNRLRREVRSVYCVAFRLHDERENGAEITDQERLEKHRSGEGRNDIFFSELANILGKALRESSDPYEKKLSGCYEKNGHILPTSSEATSGLWFRDFTF